MITHIEFRNDLDIPISIRFLITKMDNLYVDIEPSPCEDTRFTNIEPHSYEILDVQPE